MGTDLVAFGNKALILSGVIETFPIKYSNFTRMKAMGVVNQMNEIQMYKEA